MSKRPVVLGSVLVLLVLLTGCATADGDATPQQSQAAEGTSPDGDALLAALGDIDPGLDDEASLADADEVCLDIEAGAEPETIQDNARDLFSARAESDLTDDQAAQIVDAITTQYCG